jgi:hypothetical protein
MYQTTTIAEWRALLGEPQYGGTAGEVVGPWLAHNITGITGITGMSREATQAPHPTQRAPERSGAHARLGTATAAPIWGWAHPPREGTRHQSVPATASVRTAPERTELPMAPELLRAMAEAAQTTGRPEREIWAEAAREWLRRHHQSDDPQPPEPGASAPNPAALRAARERCWQAIDVLVNDLRAPQPVRPAAHADREEPAA